MSNQTVKDFNQERLLQYLRYLIYLLLFGHFILNMMGMPILKYLYLVEIVCIGIYLLKKNWSDALPLALAFAFIEGQGRVLWEYHPVFRLIFDGLLFLVLALHVAKYKSLIPKEKLPTFLLILIAAHFLWYGVQLFNTDSVGFFGVLAAAKIYIYPFLLFFLFTSHQVTRIEQLFSVQNMVILLVLFESILAIYQMTQGPDLLLSLNSYYSRPMKETIFTGAFFRPFGTGFNAGGYSTLYFLTVGFLFIAPRNMWFHISRLVVILITLGALIISQVRSAAVKYALVLLGISLALFIIQKHKVKAFVSTTLVLVILGGSYWQSGHFESLDIDLENSIKRIETLANLDKLKGQRISWGTFVDIASKKLGDNLLGIGPGRTGASASVNQSTINRDPIYGNDAGWANDNLWISLIIELGIGFIFYAIITLFIPLQLLYGGIKSMKGGGQRYRVLMVSGVTCLVVIIGNWGAIALPYNPESFLFWLWAGIGLREYYDGNMESIK